MSSCQSLIWCQESSLEWSNARLSAASCNIWQLLTRRTSRTATGFISQSCLILEWLLSMRFKRLWNYFSAFLSDPSSIRESIGMKKVCHNEEATIHGIIQGFIPFLVVLLWVKLPHIPLATLLANHVSWDSTLFGKMLSWRKLQEETKQNPSRTHSQFMWQVMHEHEENSCSSSGLLEETRKPGIKSSDSQVRVTTHGIRY